ncbi:MAG TPA: N-acetylmuramoyl-L-alanine amidase, partial [Oculatellaceae cyanobacterium]
MKLHWLLPSFLGFFLLSSPAQAARLLFWRFDANQNQLIFSTDRGVQPRALLFRNPTRLVVDLPGIDLDRSTIEQMVGGAVRRVRVGQANSRTTRLVIELNPGYTINPQQVEFRGTSPNQWVVQLPKPERVALFPSSTEPSDRSFPIPVPPPSNYPISVPPPPSRYPPTTYPRVPSGRIVVMIDPGHGGQDPGAIGIGGLQEKNVILPISQRVAAILEQQGVQAILTRTSDYFVDLAPRVQMARQQRVDLFVSIHANAVNNRPDVSGLETYYYSRQSLRLAQTIHNSILQSINIRDRRVRSARFFVLRNNPMPAVLVEVGFVTGVED